MTTDSPLPAHDDAGKRQHIAPRLGFPFPLVLDATQDGHGGTVISPAEVEAVIEIFADHYGFDGGDVLFHDSTMANVDGGINEKV